MTEWEERLRFYTSWIAAVGAAIFAIAFFVNIVYVAAKGYWDEVALKHFATVIGLPSAAVAAMFIVLLLRTVDGPIEFKVLGMEFKGASGPIVMWVLCFLAIAAGIRLLWNLEYIGKS